MAQAFAQLLRAPHDDSQMIIRERFPVPRLVVCDQHGSQVSIVYQDQFECYMSSLTVTFTFPPLPPHNMLTDFLFVSLIHQT